MNKYLFVIFSMFLFGNSLKAQRGLELGAWIGMSHYFGDLHTELSLTDARLAGGVIARYNFDKRICLKTSVNFGGLKGSDQQSETTFELQRNLDFKSNIWDLSTQIEFNFLPYVHGSKDKFFTPYLFAGLSVFSFDPTTELNGQRYRLRDFGTEGQAIGQEYGRFALSPMLGVGLKWDINVDWSFNVQLSIHPTSTDYIDDVSTVYPDLNNLAFERGQLAADLSNRALTGGVGVPGRQRGNSRNNDSYVFFGISVMRYFGTLDCPRIGQKR